MELLFLQNRKAKGLLMKIKQCKANASVYFMNLYHIDIISSLVYKERSITSKTPVF